MRLKKLFSKVFFSYLFIIIVTIIILLIFSLSSLRKYDISISKEYLHNFAKIISASIYEDLEVADYEEIAAFINLISEDSKVRITVIDSTGNVIADSKYKPAGMDNHNFRSEIIRSRNNEYGTSVRFSKTLKKYMVYVAIQLKHNNQILGYVRTSYFQSEINSIFAEIKHNVLLFAFIILAFLLTVSFIFTKRITNPINKIIETAKEVTSGNMNVKLVSKKKDEIGNLVHNFNQMIQRLKHSISEIKNQKNEIHSIVEAFSEALWVIDSDYRIQTYNESFLEFTNTDKCKNKSYKEVIENLDLIVLINKIFEGDKDNSSKEITLDDKSYYLSTSRIKHNNNIVFLLTDITELREVKIMKKDFVANASHELKTPLTSIKGFIETLKDEITEENHLYYLNVIKRNINRLINITKDIMTLNSLESKQSLEIEKIVIREVIENVRQCLSNRLAEKGIDLLINNKNNIKIEADRYRIEQVIYNLVLNAIKYSRGSEIGVEFFSDEDKCVIKINDNGIGIPADKLPRLFERFYVIDSSHSRRMGGTGLGLSIVKHIIKLHNGSIFVKSKIGQGTTFTIILPQKYENR